MTWKQDCKIWKHPGMASLLSICNVCIGYSPCSPSFHYQGPSTRSSDLLKESPLPKQHKWFLCRSPILYSALLVISLEVGRWLENSCSSGRVMRSLSLLSCQRWTTCKVVLIALLSHLISRNLTCFSMKPKQNR